MRIFVSRREPAINYTRCSTQFLFRFCLFSRVKFRCVFKILFVLFFLKISKKILLFIPQYFSARFAIPIFNSNFGFSRFFSLKTKLGKILFSYSSAVTFSVSVIQPKLFGSLNFRCKEQVLGKSKFSFFSHVL